MRKIKILFWRNGISISKVKIDPLATDVNFVDNFLIDDPRDPKKVKHKLTVLLTYGILTFVYQMASRWEADREMTRPVFMENLKLLFPELGSIPHHDTLMRLLSERWCYALLEIVL